MTIQIQRNRRRVELNPNMNASPAASSARVDGSGVATVVANVKTGRAAAVEKLAPA